jgi:hypothetical protein
VKDAIDSGAVSKKINREKQEKHIVGSPRYVKGRSYIHGDVAYAQELVDKLSGTGEPMMVNGKWTHKERVAADIIIGTHISKDGTKTKTKKGIIVYSKTGSHIYPGGDE